MKGAMIAMGASGLLIAAQQGAATLLDQEYSAMGPELSGTLKVVQQSINDGFSVWQIAVATICLPIAVKALDIYKTHAISRQEERADERKRRTLQLEAELEDRAKKAEREHELELTRLRMGQAPAEIVPMTAKPHG